MFPHLKPVYVKKTYLIYQKEISPPPLTALLSFFPPPALLITHIKLHERGQNCLTVLIQYLRKIRNTYLR